MTFWHKNYKQVRLKINKNDRQNIIMDRSSRLYRETHNHKQAQAGYINHKTM